MAKTATPLKKSAAGAVKKPSAKITGQMKTPVHARRKTAGSMATAGKMPVATAKKGKPAKPSPKSSPKKSLKTSSKNNPASMARYRCKLCGYVYSPLRGEPHNGIPAGTPFEDLPAKTLLIPLKRIWKTANLPCSKRLKAILPEWLPGYIKHPGPISEETAMALLKISASSIDRILNPIRAEYTKHGRATTKPGTLLESVSRSKPINGMNQARLPGSR